MDNKSVLYFRDGDLVAEHGNAKVYKMNNELFLEIGPGHTLWASESEIHDYMQQLQDYPKGNCLEIGLGLGVVSRYLLTFPLVKHLTTVEINPDVIAVHSKIKDEDRNVDIEYNSSKHLILNSGGIEYAYQTKKMYDFIFIDCYDRIDEDTIPVIADMATACGRLLTRNGKMMGWLDKYTPEPFYSMFQKIFDQ